MDTTRPNIKIDLPYDDNGTLKFEKVLCRQIGDYYLVSSIPVFSHAVAFGDIILLEEDNGNFYVDTVISPSGHSVIQIMIKKPEFIERLLKTLHDLGIEATTRADEFYLVVDVPPRINFSQLTSILEKYAESEIIAYRHACISDEHLLSCTKN
ncbi:DUF4265 domain-containing protein [Flaviaesturariibacter flavus]|uniref:DUF4265 domain-containing protein n=1 Tax=Flaviaesturariibacter flavus TaxID=2502780 RepID=A0A4V2NWK7_9BACT|nr:DUF4265 domain-containing protein [Flaviaesturariibacter flavus]TCJ17712.1 DUF4265 domain-containing protein [Flaviaesturariibacter flavus]